MHKNTRILIVDDEAGMCDFLAYYLGSQGFQVATARSGEEALALLEKEPFQLVLADIMMPSIDGLEMLRLVKQALPDTIVIMMTAYASLDKAMKAITYGAADLLVKPFELPILLSTIERGLAGHDPKDSAPIRNDSLHQ
jgi:two-component system, NtrC family, response regulator PilR